MGGATAVNSGRARGVAWTRGGRVFGACAGTADVAMLPTIAGRKKLSGEVVSCRQNRWTSLPGVIASSTQCPCGDDLGTECMINIDEVINSLKDAASSMS